MGFFTIASRISLVMSVFLLSVQSGYAIDRYICAASQRTGFKRNGSEWNQTNFRTQDDKFLLADLTPEQKESLKGKYDVGLTPLGKDYPGVFCKNIAELAAVYCDLPYTMDFNLKTLRYIEIYPYGYINGDEETDTPSIAIGTCTKL